MFKPIVNPIQPNVNATLRFRLSLYPTLTVTVKNHIFLIRLSVLNGNKLKMNKCIEIKLNIYINSKLID